MTMQQDLCACWLQDKISGMWFTSISWRTLLYYKNVLLDKQNAKNRKRLKINKNNEIVGNEKNVVSSPPTLI